jgi:tetratricopeptide (TPR) repeat protein
MSSLASQYSKFDNVYDSDEERERDEAAKRKRGAHAQRQQMRERQRAAANGGGAADGGAAAAAAATSGAAGPTPMMDAPNDLDVSKMTDAQREAFLENYAKMFNKNRSSKTRANYKFPDTLEEQRVICEAADELRVRGNALYKQGSTVEAAKLYEQAVLKFGDWYAECFATEEERQQALAVKLPAHLNLAACSHRLGNFQHAVVHCSSVVEHEARNAPSMNAKAFYRRGSSHVELGNLDQVSRHHP